MPAAVDTYRDLQPHPLTTPGARVDVRLAENDSQAQWTFGAGSQAILARLSESPIPNLTGIAEACGLSYRTTQRRVETLVDAGLVAKGNNGYCVTPRWLERAGDIAPALITFGRRELRAIQGCKQAIVLHDRMARHRHGDQLAIAHDAATKADADLKFWYTQLGEVQRQRVEYALLLGIDEDNIPAPSLHTEGGNHHVQQPWAAAKHGRKVVPEGRTHVGRNGKIADEMPTQPPVEPDPPNGRCAAINNPNEFWSQVVKAEYSERDDLRSAASIIRGFFNGLHDSAVRLNAALHAICPPLAYTVNWGALQAT